MNVQIAVWCHFYWKSTNPGGERFYQKLSDQAFNQVMLHKISKCEWDEKSMMVTLPTLQSELSAVIEFKNQEWVKNLAQADKTNHKKNYVDPNAGFPFQGNFSVGNIHGTNMRSDNDDVSILTMKTQDELLALLLQKRRKSKSTIGH